LFAIVYRVFPRLSLETALTNLETVSHNQPP
jgi:hypothetical protein